MMRMTFTQAPGPHPLAAHPAPVQPPWGTVELPDLGPSPRASWPLPWPWPALRRAALTHRLLAPRAIPRGPPQCPPVSSQGRPSPMISSAKPYSMPCRPLGNPAFRSVFPTPGVYAAFPVRLAWIASSFPALWRAFPLGMLGHGSRTGGRSQQGQLSLPLLYPVTMA
uniref:Uncharacterized protein n=1 Tax=Rousettus aegyptiacus TaxID=9407 RepID=A0A7J8ILJ7_ROUAE|nr:hypothetical protein HJG63_010651 [Rousettus aegyptiacus]